ncbi:MAG: tRNA (adenosine(37)-N6)-dimethylallyltransferase MiaA [Rhodospirillales bacterium]
MAKAPVVIVAGPTASGKSALALALAREFRGAVVNADSMQLYRELRVLTARPDEAALAQAPHHLYGILSARDPASAGRWRALALAAIEAARAAKRLPIVAGGTGLYLRALTEGLSPVPPVPEAVRRAARDRHAELGGEKFHAALAGRDPAAARRLKPGDTQRLIRAWEVVEATGVRLSDWQKKPGEAGPCRFFSILLMPPRAALNAAIDARFLEMMTRGALDEARSLAVLGLDPALPALKALGVPALLNHINGLVSLDEAVEAGQRASRQYAKRQATWFRHQFRPDLTIDAQYSERFLPGIFAKIRRFLLTR